MKSGTAYRISTRKKYSSPPSRAPWFRSTTARGSSSACFSCTTTASTTCGSRRVSPSPRRTTGSCACGPPISPIFSSRRSTNPPSPRARSPPTACKSPRRPGPAASASWTSPRTRTARCFARTPARSPASPSTPTRDGTRWQRALKTEPRACGIAPRANSCTSSPATPESAPAPSRTARVGTASACTARTDPRRRGGRSRSASAAASAGCSTSRPPRRSRSTGSTRATSSPFSSRPTARA